jgi:hypothetical protein
MVVKPFVREVAKDPIVNRIQTNVALVLDAVVKQPGASRKVIHAITLTSGSVVTVNHALGHTPQYHQIKKNGPGDFWDVQSTNPTPTSTLWLMSNANMTIDLLVF